jgi:hypothetical protein
MESVCENSVARSCSQCARSDVPDVQVTRRFLIARPDSSGTRHTLFSRGHANLKNVHSEQEITSTVPTPVIPPTLL